MSMQTFGVSSMQRKRIFLILVYCFLMSVFISHADWTKYERETSYKDSLVILNELPLSDYSSALYASELKEATANYLELEKLYIKWRDGLFGSRRYRKRLLVEYLVSKIGSEIITDYNYIVNLLEVENNRRIHCNLIYQRWLRIIGKIEVESAKKLFRNHPELLKEWSRSGTLLSVYGKIRKFRLDRDRRGYVVILYLDNIHLFSSK